MKIKIAGIENQVYPSWTNHGKDNKRVVFGGASNGAEFEGKYDTYLSLGEHLFHVKSQGFTVTTQFKYKSLEDQSRIFDFSTGANGDSDFYLCQNNIQESTESFNMRFSYSIGSGANQILQCDFKFLKNTVYSVMLSYEPPSSTHTIGEMYFWVDGTLCSYNDGSNNNNIKTLTNSSADNYMSTAAQDVTFTSTNIGKSSYIEDPYFRGEIYVLDFYDRLISGTEEADFWGMMPSHRPTPTPSAGTVLIHILLL